MKTSITIKKLVPCSCLVWLALSATAASDVKIATIDLKTVFEKYYKTVLADAAIKDELSGLKKEEQALMDDLQKSTDEYKKALDEANNQAVSTDEREKRKKEAEGKLIKVNDLKQTIDQFGRTARGNLDEKQRQAKEKIIKEIRDVVTSKAKAAGYTMVIDSTAQALTGVPVVFYTNGDNDITTGVIAQLNANAPPDLLKSEDKKPETEKKEDKRDKKDGKK